MEADTAEEATEVEVMGTGMWATPHQELFIVSSGGISSFDSPLSLIFYSPHNYYSGGYGGGGGDRGGYDRGRGIVCLFQLRRFALPH